MPSDHDKPPLDDLNELLGEEPSKIDQQVSVLEKQLEYERDARKEERFLYIAVIVLLFDIMLFTVIENPTAPIAIIVLEIAILTPIARRMGIDEIASLLDRAQNRISNLGSGD